MGSPRSTDTDNKKPHRLECSGHRSFGRLESERWRELIDLSSSSLSPSSSSSSLDSLGRPRFPVRSSEGAGCAKAIASTLGWRGGGLQTPSSGGGGMTSLESPAPPPPPITPMGFNESSSDISASDELVQELVQATGGGLPPERKVTSGAVARYEELSGRPGADEVALGLRFVCSLVQDTFVQQTYTRDFCLRSKDVKQ